MVSAGGHEDWHVGTSVVRSAQQTSLPGHGTVGHVGPASPPLPLLEPLLLPELLPELPPLPLPEPPPLELLRWRVDPPELLPDDELPLLASGPDVPRRAAAAGAAGPRQRARDDDRRAEKRE